MREMKPHDLPDATKQFAFREPERALDAAVTEHRSTERKAWERFESERRDILRRYAWPHPDWPKLQRRWPMIFNGTLPPESKAERQLATAADRLRRALAESTTRFNDVWRGAVPAWIAGRRSAPVAGKRYKEHREAFEEERVGRSWQEVGLTAMWDPDAASDIVNGAVELLACSGSDADVVSARTYLRRRVLSALNEPATRDVLGEDWRRRYESEWEVQVELDDPKVEPTRLPNYDITDLRRRLEAVAEEMPDGMRTVFLGRRRGLSHREIVARGLASSETASRRQWSDAARFVREQHPELRDYLPN